MNSNFRLILIFSIAFSLATLAGPMSSNFHLPTVQMVRANPDPCVVHGESGACSASFWYPAGPAMNTLQENIYTDQTAEYINLQSSSSAIDFTDTPCYGTPVTGVCGSLQTSPNFLVTAPVAEVGYYEIQFHLAQSFWGCNFNFGNAACGVQIRQGIAHMVDKNKFTANQANIAGVATPIDNAVPTTSAGGLPSPNPCGYDASFPQGTAGVAPCQVGAPGGTAYHLAAATGANGIPWLASPGSLDLNAAAQHFVNAGVATGFNSATSVLTGISSTAASNSPIFLVRFDNPQRKDLGETLSQEICYLFTGVYTLQCSYLRLFDCGGGSVPYAYCPEAFGTSTTGVNPAWSMYTAAYNGPTLFDGSLYSSYNSRFVSGVPSIQPPNGPCSAGAVPTASAADYMYLCSPTYDSLSSQMETAPCLTAQGDPAIGAGSNLPTSPGNGICPGTAQLSAVTAGIQAEAHFGANVFTLPVFELTVQFGFLNNGWVRDINGVIDGLPNYFTWLNAWNPSPTQPGTIREGFLETTKSVNPYIASTVHDSYLVGEVYDSLFAPNPLAPQLLDWMTYTAVQQNNATVLSQSGYTPPASTLTTYHFTLRNDVYFQDGRPVTAYDVAFSYLSIVGSGAFLGTGATSMTGITVLGLRAFDIGVKSLGVFTLPNLTVIPIIPARYWTGAGSSTWDSAVAACVNLAGCAKAQYVLSRSTVTCPTAGGQPGCASFPAANMQVDRNKISATFDPIANHIFLGSGAWECGPVTSSGSGTCSSTGAQNPPAGSGSYTLTRFGNGLPPASSTSGIYFRSSGDLALWIWSQENDVNPITAVSAVSVCFSQPLNFANCAHWQHGIGASSNGVVGINQVSAVELRYGLNWVSPKNWATDPPLGIGPLPPTLYEGSVVLNNCTTDPVNGYDC